MKPEWGSAPEWAKYLAQDDNGRWYWYERKPKQHKGYWVDDGGHFEDACPCLKDWRETLEERP